MTPTLLTFDVFGTLVDWRAGLRADLAPHGIDLTDREFEHVLAAQEVDETGPFLSYAEIAAESLTRALGVSARVADPIGRNVGKWPLYPDSAAALRRLLARARCVAMTNSDRVHGEQVQEQLGFKLTDWVSAEEVGVYKPAVAFWEKVAARLGVAPGPAWWHVSAYADYDLDTARGFGLTTVFVARPHARPGAADVAVRDLTELAGRIEALTPAPVPPPARE
jgi:2-haloalkanoic acid dehalogenase type II